ncbi:MAG TPA: serine hydrolase domain-containing protein [Bryobacteraceae bacterium]|nr:serine hydrolase domain-containing protein [Bryobacteraceae bacterium]
MTLFAQAPKPIGDYSGMLGPLHLKLHLKTSATGSIEGALDSVDQGANGLPCANFQLKNGELSFEVPSVGGKWHGTVSDDAAVLKGSWSQGQELPLTFHRDGSEPPFVAAEKPSRVDGIWLGTLAAGGAKLRVQVQVKSDRAGKEYCSLDSLDQGAMGLACENVALQQNHFSFEVPSVRGQFAGTLSEDGNEIEGTWTQGQGLPLRLTRQSTALAAKAPEPPKYDPARPPVPVDELKTVLDRDLAVALKDGALAPGTGIGAVIAVIQHGTRLIFVYGPVKEDSIFEIGSITKTFTGLLLAQLVAQHKVKLEEPVRDLLPPGTVAKPAGAEITLLDLVTQHSGLPRLPDNFHPADPRDPYADYRAVDLYEFLAKHGVSKPERAEFNYSNLGLGLLGQALANRTAMTYPDLLKTEITGPLHLSDTVVKLSAGQEKRFAAGHAGPHQPVHAWNLDALAGAGAIRSTAGDMLSYLEAQLHPRAIQHATGLPAGSPAETLAEALEMSHELRADSLPGMKIGFAWLFNAKTGNYWHNGATGGYSSYAFFNPNEDYAAVVLVNTTIGQNGSLADRLGEHIAERLSGKPAISIGD